MITPDNHRHVYLPVVDAMFSPVDISKNEELGVTSNLEDCSHKEIDPKFVVSVASSEEARKRSSQPLPLEKEANIRKAANLELFWEHLRKA